MIIFIAQIQGQTGTLTEDESWHCSKVLRKKAGEKVRLIDGQGRSFEAVLEQVTDRKCTARIVAELDIQESRPYHLHLAIAPTKQTDRIEWLVEKAVEMGVAELSFFCSERTERDKLNTDRLRKIAESAVKQSLQARLPLLHGLCRFDEILTRGKESRAYLAHCLASEKVNISALQFSKAPHLVLIGPEGDFTEAEVRAALEAGFKGLDLGNTRLRTETAGLFTCAAARALAMKTS